MLNSAIKLKSALSLIAITASNQTFVPTGSFNWCRISDSAEFLIEFQQATSAGEKCFPRADVRPGVTLWQYYERHFLIDP